MEGKNQPRYGHGAAPGGRPTSQEANHEHEAPPFAAPTADESRVRLTTVAGTLASVAIVVAFFLPWVEVSTTEAARYRERIEQRLEDPVQPLPADVAKGDWLRLAKLA